MIQNEAQLRQALEQIQDLVACFSIQIARRFVAQQQRGIGHNGPGDAYPLLFAPRELPRVVLGTMTEPDHG